MRKKQNEQNKKDRGKEEETRREREFSCNAFIYFHRDSHVCHFPGIFFCPKPLFDAHV